MLRGLLIAILLGLAAAALYADPTGNGPLTVAPAPTGSVSAGVPLHLPSGLAGVPVPLGEPAALAVVRAGDRIDLVALPPAPGLSTGRPRQSGPSTVAADVLVLDALHSDGNPVLYLALTQAQASAVLATAPSVRFGVIVRSR